MLDSGRIHCLWAELVRKQNGGWYDCPTNLQVASVATSMYGHACLLTTSNGLYCWGDNESGQVLWRIDGILLFLPS